MNQLKFNFYDIYGYLLPGAAFLLLLPWPWLFVSDMDFLTISPGAAGIVVVIGPVAAYLVGFLLAELAREIIPSEVDRRYAGNNWWEWAPPSHAKIASSDALAQILRSKLDTASSEGQGPKLSFGDQFKAARALTETGKLSIRPQQMQAMQVLSRGLVAALGIAAIVHAYAFGAPFLGLEGTGYGLVITAVLLGGLLGARREFRPQAILSIVVISGVAGMAGAATQVPLAEGQHGWEWAIVVLYLLLATVLFRSHTRFATQFAASVVTTAGAEVLLGLRADAEE